MGGGLDQNLLVSYRTLAQFYARRFLTTRDRLRCLRVSSRYVVDAWRTVVASLPQHRSAWPL